MPGLWRSDSAKNAEKRVFLPIFAAPDKKIERKFANPSFLTTFVSSFDEKSSATFRNTADLGYTFCMGLVLFGQTPPPTSATHENHEAHAFFFLQFFKIRTKTIL